MAVTVDELFKRDLDDILKDAEELLKDDNPDTKAFVTTQITDLQAILKQKQLETEQQLQKEIDEEEKEIESMKERIKKLQAGGVEDSTDEALDHMKLWKDLKDNEWKEVFGFFIRETSEQVPIIHERLIKILKIAYETAGDKMRVSRAQIVYQVMQPGAVFEMEIKQAWKAPEPKEEELYELSSQCQFKAMPFCIDAIKKNIRDAIVDEHKKLCTVPDASDAFNKALDYYFLKCIEFSWAAAFEEKLPILLVTDPQKNVQNFFLTTSKVSITYVNCVL